jgi:LPS-assembly lipoprotein
MNKKLQGILFSSKTMHSSIRPTTLRLTLLALGLMLLMGLTACGFQLRGQYNVPFNSIGLRGLEKSDMYRTMQLQLQILDVQVNPSSSTLPPPLQLSLVGEQRERSIVTFSASGRAREVRLTYTLTYHVTDPQGDYQIATSKLTQFREITYSDDQILGKEAEENRLVAEMQRDIARQIISRLAVLKPATELPPTQPALP